MTSKIEEIEETHGNIKKLKRCLWTKEEDEALLKLTQKDCQFDWLQIAEEVNSLRPSQSLPKSAKQCRERWHNRVNPAIKQSPWTDCEIDLFFKLFRKYGAKWSQLSLELGGRTDNTVKNFFYCRMRKIARRIKKSEISDDMKSSSKEIEYNLFLINYLLSYCNGDKTCPLNDKYLIEILKSPDLSLKQIEAYLKKYKAFVQSFNQASETDDSLSKSNHKLLPNILKRNVKLEFIPRKCKVISESDTKFFTQLLFMENGQDIDLGAMLLPIPKSFSENSNKTNDDIKPKFAFNKRTETKYYLCILDSNNR